MTSEKLALFGHHPEPAIDFCIEVEALEGWAYELKVGMRNDLKSFWGHLSRLLRFGREQANMIQADTCAPQALEAARGLEKLVLGESQ